MTPPESRDVEKAVSAPSPDRGAGPPQNAGGGDDDGDGDTRQKTLPQRLRSQLARLDLETRGVQRVEPHERHDLRTLGYTQVSVLWFSINLAANNVTLGMLGPEVFGLGFADSSLCAVLGVFVGCLPVAYVAAFGPRSGNRTLIVARYAMGWWPAKLVVALNIVVLLGYALIDAVVAGQVLAAAAPRVPVVAGILVVSAVTWAVTTFGYRCFHYYERYAWLPQLVVFCVLAGAAGPRFDLTTPSYGDRATVAGARLSFFSLCLAAAITYSGGAADYFVYYPERTPALRVCGATLLGLVPSFAFALVLGAGLASGAATNEAWAAAAATSQGALLVEGFAPLGAFGRACAVVVALGLVANMAPPTYSAGVCCQVLGRAALRVPRVAWNAAGVLAYTACALAGRQSLAAIFVNFLALMGYWVCIWVAILLEEHLVFRRRRGFDWAAWNAPEKLPRGLAALAAFLLGWVGAVLCMAQVWYTGPIAKLVGEHGADVSRPEFLIASLPFAYDATDGKLCRFRTGRAGLPSAESAGTPLLWAVM